MRIMVYSLLWVMQNPKLWARLRLETYARPLPKSHPSLLKKSWLKNLLAWISASQELVEDASCIGAATGCDAGLCNVCMRAFMAVRTSSRKP